MPGISTPLARIPAPADKRNDPKSVVESSISKKDAAESKLDKLAASALKEVEEDVEQVVKENSPTKEGDIGSKVEEG